MSIFLAKLGHFFKVNWKTLLVALAAVIVMWNLQRAFKSKESQLTKQMDDLSKIHEDHMSKTREAYEKELAQRDKNIKQLSKDLNESKAEYDAYRREIENKKKVNIAKTTQTYKGDPKGLAQKVNSVLGFEVVLPKGVK